MRPTTPRNGTVADELSLSIDMDLLLQRIDRDRDAPSSPLMSNPVVFEIEFNGTFCIHGSLEMLSVPFHQPGVRIDFSRH